MSNSSLWSYKDAILTGHELFFVDGFFISFFSNICSVTYIRHPSTKKHDILDNNPNFTRIVFFLFDLTSCFHILFSFLSHTHIHTCTLFHFLFDSPITSEWYGTSQMNKLIETSIEKNRPIVQIASENTVHSNKWNALIQTDNVEIISDTSHLWTLTSLA